VGWSCQFDGHLFYVLSLPHGPLTPVYDVSQDAWTAWAHGTRDQWLPLRAQNHVTVFGTHLVGDPLSGTIYELVLEPDDYADRLVA
jgi:hypothetical protein